MFIRVRPRFRGPGRRIRWDLSLVHSERRMVNGRPAPRQQVCYLGTLAFLDPKTLAERSSAYEAFFNGRLIPRLAAMGSPEDLILETVHGVTHAFQKKLNLALSQDQISRATYDEAWDVIEARILRETK